MFGSAVLEVLIGLVFVFLVLSVVCSALNEGWAGLTAARARVLELGIRQLLGAELTKRFFAHARIAALSPPDRWGFVTHSGIRKRPSYIANTAFAEVTLDLLAPASEVVDGQVLRHAAGARLWKLAKYAEHSLSTKDAVRPAAPIESQLSAILGRAHTAVAGEAADRDEQTLAAVAKGLESLFQETMDRATGWYRRRAQGMALVFAIPVVLLANVDAIELTRAMYAQPTLRAELVKMAEARVAAGAPASTANVAEVDALKAQLQSAKADLAKLVEAKLPLGWETGADWDLEKRWMGWCLSMLAASLGAPFWFQLLSKLVSLRGSNKPAAVGLPGEPTAQDVASVVPSAAGGVVVPSPVPAKVPTPPKLDGAYFENLAKSEYPSALAWAKAKNGNATELGLALDCARFAAIVYRDLTVASKFAAMCGYQSIGTADRSGTQAMVVTTATDVVVCYRGTEPDRLEDWLADAKFQLQSAVSAFGKGEVHGGFVKALTATLTEIDALIDNALAAGKRFVFTGHSLGGALATLHARRRFGNAGGAEIALVTFGSPRVGDAAFVAGCKDLDGGLSLRFVNGRDIVTRMPPRSLGFDHLGAVRYFDDHGVLQNDGAEWFRWLADFLDATADWKATAGRTVGDHSMEFYVARVEAAFRAALAAKA